MSQPPDRNIRYLLPLLLSLGLAVRLVVYLQNRSLFLDEANLARNIVERPFSGFFAPLDYQQYAPPLFLVLEKISWLAAGASEWSLRFWPLIMGCLALWFFYLLCNKFSSHTLPKFLILWLFAFSQVYIRYATELKQYSTDMAVTAFLIWSALCFSPFERRRYCYYWIISGSLAVWLSMPAVFVLAGVGVYFLYLSVRERPRHSWIVLSILAGSWLLQFAAYYLLILGKDLQTANLITYHQPHFWPLWPDEAADWQRMGRLAGSLVGAFSGHTAWALAVGLACIATAVYKGVKTDPGKVLLPGLPVLLCLLASALGKYSLMERLSLFMMPLLGLLMLSGLDAWWSKTAGPGRWCIALAFLPILPLSKGLVHFKRPLQVEEMRPLLQHLDTLVSPGNLVWVAHNARPAFVWYTTYAPSPPTFPENSRIIFNHWPDMAAGELKDSKATFMWLVFSHLVSEQNRTEMNQELDAMKQQYGDPVRELRRPGAAAFAFER